MKKIIGLLMAVALLSGACNNNNTAGDARTTDTAQATVAESAPIADMHNAENSLDIAGTYTGLLPCADCEGIETTLSLNGDQRFVLKESYKGKKEAMAFEMKGKWVIHENTLTLQFDKEVQDRILQYRVEEGQLRQLDQQGKTIEGKMSDLYILKKQAQ